MAITGGIKFFSLTSARPSLVTGASASSGNASVGALIDGNPYTKWQSVGSNDSTTETIIIPFTYGATISRIHVANMNWKDFDIMYDIGAGYVHFAAVVGLDGSKTNITETAFADSSCYYEFTPVLVDSIRIRVNKSQIANAQKYAFSLFAFTELGTFIGYPKVSTSKHSRNERAKKTASEKYKIQKSFRTAEYGLAFTSYPTETVYRADITLVQTLFDLEDPFHVWLCGGRRGEDYFRHSIFGWNLKDVITMSPVGEWNPVYRENLYIGGVNANLRLVEAVP